MNWIKDLANYLSSIFKWWVIVLPWQEGVRVRLGRFEKRLPKGIYLKLPIVDSVFVQNVRFHISQMPVQTITAKSGETVTVNGMIAYQIVDILKLYKGITNPDATLVGLAMSGISQYVATHNLSEINPVRIATNVPIDVEKYGIVAELKINSFAVVRTYRLIQDHTWMPTAKEHEI